jgi:uncharacterized protein YdiU (UPF0061 family)
MRLLEINNQYNISHKAYFRPNTEFKKLWSYAKLENKSSELQKKLIDIKTNKPNHELEILEHDVTIDEAGKLRIISAIFNNTTKKALGILQEDNSNKTFIGQIFETILKDNADVQNFFRVDLEHVQNYNNITKSL